MGVTFISPCYASSTGGEIVIDASADDEHPPTSGQGNRAVGEAVGPSRSFFLKPAEGLAGTLA